jgi:hypothetical protein
MSGFVAGGQEKHASVRGAIHVLENGGLGLSYVPVEMSRTELRLARLMMG